MAINHTIGINITDTAVNWTSLRNGQEGLELHEFETKPRPEPDTLPPLFHPHQADRLIAGLPSTNVLTHVFNLPSTDTDEIAGMVELQLDKISPYPLQQLVASYEILAQGETHTLVLVAGVRREIVEQLGAQLNTIGLTLNSLDLELLCRWQQLLMENRIAAEGGEAIFIIEKGTTGLIIAVNGEPLLFRTLPSSHSAEELLSELDYSLTTLEQEFDLQGVERIDLWSDDPQPELSETLEKQVHLCSSQNSLSELPPLSEALARRYHNRGQHQLELIPPEWIEVARNKTQIRKLYKFGAILLASWLSLVLLFSIAYGIHKHQVSKLRTTADELTAPAQAVKESSRKVNTLLNYTDQDHSALEALREISALLPNGIDLSAFSYKKGRALTLRGAADSSDAVYKFFDTLAQSKFFKEIKDQRVTTANRKGQRISQFSLTAVLEGAES